MSSLEAASILLGIYSHFLPSGVDGGRLYQALKSMDFTTQAQEKMPSVTFMSGESLSDKGNPVLNRVSLIEKEGYDMWLMRQYISPKKTLPQDIPNWKNWDFVGILVDKTKAGKTAYYFEFDPKEVPTGQLPGLAMFRASCANCHVSGPRVIRPKARESSAFPLKETKAGLMTVWNQKIANYRVVEDYLSDHEATMFPSHSSQSEILELEECAECHNKSNHSVRGPLRRKHGDSILYLVKHLEMPMIDEGESKKRHTKNILESQKRYSCLKQWIDSSQNTPGLMNRSKTIESSSHMALQKCMSRILVENDKTANVRIKKASMDNLASRAADQNRELVPYASQILVSEFKLTTKTELSVGPGFEMTGIKLSSMGLECGKSSVCFATGKLSLNHITTGIHLRDQHLASWLKKNRALDWNIRVDLSSLKDSFADKGSPSTSNLGLIARITAEVSPESRPSKIAKTTLQMNCQGVGVSASLHSSFVDPRNQNSGRALVCTLESSATYFKLIAEDSACFLGVCVLPLMTVSGSFKVDLPKI